MIYAYYGDGQGKTSALNGMILRSLNVSDKILIVRFFKSEKWNQSEDVAFKKLGLKVHYFQECKGFIWNQSKQAKIVENANNGLAWLMNNFQNYEYLFLDEFIDLVTNKILTSEEFKNILTTIGKDKKVFISGHYMDKEIETVIDVLTNTKKIKHHFDKGVYAIKGIDY